MSEEDKDYARIVDWLVNSLPFWKRRKLDEFLAEDVEPEEDGESETAENGGTDSAGTGEDSSGTGEDPKGD